MQIKIENMIRNAKDGVVADVYWCASESDGDKTVSIYGGSTLTPIDYFSQSFVPFDELAEDQVRQWVIAELGSEGAQNVQDQLNKLLSSSSFHSITGIPWN
jgi:hypothetical protein